MNLDCLLKAAQKNTSNPIQKRCSLEIGPAKKLSKSKVDPNAIRALLERKEKERREERDTLISKAIASTKRDDIHYKDHKGLRKQEQGWSDKCKRQWLKVQRERREFINQMHRAADERDKHKRPLDKEKVMLSVKSKEEQARERKKRKRKYEIFEGSMDTSRRNKIRLSVVPGGAGPRVSDISELMKIAQNNAESGSFGADCNLPFDLSSLNKNNSDEEPRLMTNAEKRRIAEEEAIMRKAASSGNIPRIPKIASAAANGNGSGKPINGIGRIPKKGEQINSSTNGAIKSNSYREHQPFSSASKSSSRSERSRSERDLHKDSKSGGHRDRERSSSSSHKSKDSRERMDKDRHKDVQRKEFRDHKETKDRHRDHGKESKEKCSSQKSSNINSKLLENGHSRQHLNGSVATSKNSQSRDTDRLAASTEQSSKKLSQLQVLSTGGRVAASLTGNNNQSMPAADRERLRAETARKLEQLQKERMMAEEEERKKRLAAKKLRQAEEALLKKRLRELQNSGAMDSDYEDDEYDYEDEDLDAYEDDFIDDAPIDDPYAKNYSKDIAKIFKYDKRKYQDMDDDDIEESTFSRCMAEEARSSRIGRQEDLEDMRREQEEELRKSKSKSRKLEELAQKLKQKKKLTLCPV